MRLAKNARVTHSNLCDRCKDDRKTVASTHRIQLDENCVWQWLCDDHTRIAIINEANYQASIGQPFKINC